MNITRKLVPNYEKGRRGYITRCVVWHTGEGNRNAIYSEFLNNEKSSHYCVNNDGTIWQFVELENTAWHAGVVVKPTAPILKDYPNLNPNLISVGVENEGYGNHDIDDDQYILNAELALFFFDKFNIPLERKYHLRHQEINGNKTCPGKISVEKILFLANKLKTHREAEALAEEEKKKQELERKVGLLEQLLALYQKLLELIGLK